MTIIYKVKCRECKKLFNESYVDDNYICHNCMFNPYQHRAIIDISDHVTKGLEKKSRWKFW